jgi:tetratricopeptide (TPR) repeat protein
MFIVSGHRRAAVSCAALAVLALLAASCGRFGGPHQRGEWYLSAGDYESARQAFNEAIDAGDNVAVAYANRCLANESLGDYESAIRDCTASLDHAEQEAPEGYPRHEVLNNRAVAFLGLAMIAEAMADLDAAIELDPEYADAYANRGRILLDQEDFSGAIAELDQAIEFDAELAEAFGNRGLAYESLGDDELALEDYTSAIEIAEDPQAYFNRAMLRYTLGYFDLAYEDFLRVTELAEGTYLAHRAQVQVDFLDNRPKGFDPQTGVTAEP